MPEKDVLTPAEAAEYIGVAARTLQSWRSQGQGPRFVRIGFGQGVFGICRQSLTVGWIDVPSTPRIPIEFHHQAQQCRQPGGPRHLPRRLPITPSWASTRTLDSVRYVPLTRHLHISLAGHKPTDVANAVSAGHFLSTRQASRVQRPG